MALRQSLMRNIFKYIYPHGIVEYLKTNALNLCKVSRQECQLVALWC